MSLRCIVAAVVVAGLVGSPAQAASKKRTRTAVQAQQTMAPGPVGAAVGTAGAIAGGAVATAGAIATAPFNAGMAPPVSTINGPTCRRGELATINGRKMRCQ